MAPAKQDIPVRRNRKDAAMCILWLLFAVMVTVQIVGGTLARYVRLTWWPLLLIAALIIAVFAVNTLRRTLRGDAVSHAHDGEPDTSRIQWLLLLPVLLITLCAPSSLGSAMLDNTTTGGGQSGTRPNVGVLNASGSIDFPPLDPSGVNELTLEEISDRYTFGEPEALDGQKISFVGFVSHGDSVGGRDVASGEDTATVDADRVLVNRFKIYCCAADAIAYTVQLNGGGDFADDQWVEVEGVANMAASEGGIRLVVDAQSVTPIHSPKVPYL
ncbi:TIGR03943 family putative permease subunit [Corynebacterium uterequi]|uniref:Putative TIGR03943 family protein n=1 Tax=Corynebacterium uterequi TaxID=1072256 RepID=A0A0G3HH92_9CORY|nr:TIGR03943 family protein [Corynebacterium uterequi]AKK12120.1 putative TIGR03943 family protein [Corynebacterium uterequi]